MVFARDRDPSTGAQMVKVALDPHLASVDVPPDPIELRTVEADDLEEDGSRTSASDSASEYSEDEGSEAAQLLEDCLLEPWVAPPPPHAPPVLRGTRFAVTGLFEATSSAGDEGQHADGPTAAPVLQLLQAGAQGTQRTLTPELVTGLTLGGSKAAINPRCPQAVAGGTAAGAAMAVAAGTVDFTLATDHLVGLRVAAACCGCYGVLPSQGTVGHQGVLSVSESLDGVGYITQDPMLLHKIGDALKLPGGGLNSKVDLARLVVAADLFLMSSESMQRAEQAVSSAARRWAGPDQVARVPLLHFLADSVKALGRFTEGQEPVGPTNIMKAMRHAAVLLQQHEFAQAHPQLVASTSRSGLPDEPDHPSAAPYQPAIAHAGSSDAYTDADSELGGSEASLNVSETAEEPGTSGTVADSKETVRLQKLEEVYVLMRQLGDAMRIALANGTMLIIPTLPGPPVDLNASAEDVEDFENGAIALSSLASLAGIPQVAIPVNLPGERPLSVSILGLQKSDMRVLAVAAALGPLIGQEVERLEGKRAEQAAAKQSGGKAKAGAKKTGKGKAASPKKAAKASHAERCKAAGNEAFKAGDFDRAIQEYSGAIQADPASAVYYSNRAMALLKVMRFEEAEADCNAALRLELNAKTLLRRGTARMGLQQIDKARADFKQVLALEPNNRQARLELQNVKEVEAMMTAVGGGADMTIDPHNPLGNGMMGDAIEE
ncbi:hypothetical protein WJX72_000870 [[Myrmecia] bisecta]|uniref:Amidase domain-containing protein n=1 Tax=[Myrmecia] bisecta TaxID=41462 RepID=A0AAW1PA30_9CHLO